MKRISNHGRIGLNGVPATIGSIVLLLVVSAAMGQAQTAAGGCSPGQSASNEVLTELRKLRTEIFEYRIESRTEDIARLEQALQQVRGERLRLEDDERTRSEQIAEAETYLATQGQTLTPEQKMQFEAMKAGMMATPPDKMRLEHAAVMKREAEADDRLRMAQQHLQQLKAMKNQLVSRGSSGN